MQKLWSLKGKRFAKQLLFENWVYTSSLRKEKSHRRKCWKLRCKVHRLLYLQEFFRFGIFSIYLFKFIYLVESVEVLWSWFDWKINCTSCCWCQESKKSCTSLRFSSSFVVFSLFCISSDSSLLLSNTGKLFLPSRLLLLLFWWEVSTSQDSSI